MDWIAFLIAPAASLGGNGIWLRKADAPADRRPRAHLFIGAALVLAMLFLIWLIDPLMSLPLAAMVALLVAGWAIVVLARWAWWRVIG